MSQPPEVQVLSAVRTGIGKFGGGAESMSRGQYWLPDMRWGRRMQDAVVVDAMVGALTDPFDHCHMGGTAENVAAEFGVSRADQDALAGESHRRAAHATDQGYFAGQITPVEVPGRRGTTSTFTADEHIRPGVNADDLARLRPAFDSDGTVTAGNASGVNDASAAVVLATGEYAAAHGLQPLGRLVGYSHALHELHRTGGRYALTTMCIGGGQGIAAIFERV